MNHNPHLALAALFLGVALYMFAALKFRPLLFLFRLKRTPARALGMDGEANRNFSNKLGFILAPIIGVVALIAAGHNVVQWRQLNQQMAAHAQEKEERRALAVSQAKSALASLEFDLIYKGVRRGDRDTLLPSAADREKIEAVIRQVAAAIDGDDVQVSVPKSPREADAWKVDFKLAANSPYRRATFVLHPADGLIAVTDESARKGAIPAASGFVHIKVPEELSAQYGAIASMPAVPGGEKTLAPKR